MSLRDPVERIGEGTARTWRDLRHVTAVATMALAGACRPGTWRRTVRAVFVRQLYFSGAQAVAFVVLIAALIGTSLMLQADLWLREIGQSDLLGPFLVWLVAEEIGPVLINIIVIVRSGSAIAIELGNMHVSGEVRLVEAQGLDVLRYLVIPRTVALMLAVLCLDVIFCTVAFASGYGCQLLLGATNQSPLEFADTILRATQRSDVLIATVKCIVPAMVTAVICCTDGLAVGTSPTEVPRAATRALSRSIASLFIVTILIAAATYAYL